MDIHPTYRDGLNRILEDVRHEGALVARDGLVLATAQSQGVILQALVEKAGHKVVQAAFQHASSQTVKGLMEAVCKQMEGRPIQECADHAVIALENQLRDRTQPAPVRGVITPDNADPAFAQLQAIVRSLRDQYANLTGFVSVESRYEQLPTPRWIQLPEDQRVAELSIAIASQGLTEHLRIRGMQGMNRAIVEFTGPLGSMDKQSLLVKLESMLQATVEPTLQIMAEVKSDTNVVRIPTKEKPT